MTFKESLGFTVLSLLMPYVLLCLQAGCTTSQPTAAELHRLQGYWESVLPAKNSITITGNSLHYYARTDFWYETTFTLPAGTDPQQLHATIKRCSYPASIGKVVIAFFKIEDGTLTLAYLQTGAAPKSFEDEEADRFKLRKVQPQKKNTELPKSNEPEMPNEQRIALTGARAPVSWENTQAHRHNSGRNPSRPLRERADTFARFIASHRV